MYKQQLYDVRVQWIQNRLDGLRNFNEDLLRQLNPKECDYINNYIDTWVNSKLNGHHLDYADNYIFNQIYNQMKTFEKWIYDNYQIFSKSRESNRAQAPMSNNVRNEGKSNTKEYSGEVEVITNAPILELPVEKDQKIIGKAGDGRVTIVKKFDDYYYLIRSGNLTGYMFVGWIK